MSVIFFLFPPHARLLYSFLRRSVFLSACVIFDYSPLGNVWHTLCLLFLNKYCGHRTQHSLSLHRSLLRDCVREELLNFFKKCLRKLVWLTSDEIFSRRSPKNPTTAGQNYYYYYFLCPRRKSVSDFLAAKK